MSAEAGAFQPSSLPIPPAGYQPGCEFSYGSCNKESCSEEPCNQQRSALARAPRADYVASPLAMAALFDWGDDEDD